MYHPTNARMTPPHVHTVRIRRIRINVSSYGVTKRVTPLRSSNTLF
jgi:hypothetical protein